MKTAYAWFLLAAILFIMGLGCAMLREKGPELLKVVCPRCAAAFELLKGTDHTHDKPSRDGASHD